MDQYQQINCAQQAQPIAQTLNQQLHALLVKLHTLGQELPQILIYLTQIAQPKLPHNLLIPLLGQMFEKVPPFLSRIDSNKLAEYMKDPPTESVPLRILIDLSHIQQLLQHISVLQLLHLTNNIIPPGPQETQESFFKKVQETFQSWTPDILKRYHATLSETPLHLERQQLLQLEPHIPWEILHLLIELLKLPLEELFAFQGWLVRLPANHIRVLVQLLQIESATLLEIKRRISPSPTSVGLTSSAMSLPTTTSPGTTTSISSPATMATSTTTPPSIVDRKGKKRRAEEDISSLRADLEMIGSGNITMDVEPLMIGYPTDSMIGGHHHPVINNSSPATQHLSTGFTPPVTPTLLATNSTTSSIAQNASNSYTSSPLTKSLSITTLPNASSPLASSILSDIDVSAFSRSTEKFQIRIARQPPTKTVYQRILKPFPSVMLLTGQDNDANLFVEAQLMRSDNDIPLPQCIDGNRVVRISNGVFATFKKLKILSTSQQQGTLFRLRFTLKRYAGSQASFEDVPSCSIISNPIEVFSHTQYLNEKQDGNSNASLAPPPPVVSEVLPTSGPHTGGTRIVILGSNFISCPGLKVRFGDMVVPVTFHEAGTLICVTPARGVGRTAISVTNDGINFCETQTYFSFE